MSRDLMHDAAVTEATGVVLLDGAMGTELARRGFALEPPLFAAAALLDAPERVEQIHSEYIRAGAQVITTNSFGLHMHTLARAGVAERASELVERSVIAIERARRAAAADDPSRVEGWAKIRVAGSLPPVRMAGPRALKIAEQRVLAGALVAAGVDLLLLETHTSVDEVAVSLAAVAELDAPVWLSVVAGAPTGTGRPDGSRLLGGDEFTALIEALGSARVDALLINCTQIDAVPAAMRSLVAARAQGGEGVASLPLGLYPHLGRASWDGTWHDRFLEPEVYAGQIAAWLAGQRDFVIAGACCGSSPDDIAALRRVVQGEPEARERAFMRLAAMVP